MKQAAVHASLALLHSLVDRPSSSSAQQSQQPIQIAYSALATEVVGHTYKYKDKYKDKDEDEDEDE
ncbi:MAG: hypothetical protein KDA60_22930, partial [Planctomycetales bacterium]|nr:hypothetical protein [Planctomycetales bacterium]